MNKTKEFEKLLLSTVIRGNDSKGKEIANEIYNKAKNIIPEKLFRYRSCNERSFDALFNDKVYFNSPENFNDPYDCLVYVDEKKIQDELNKSAKKEFLIEQMKALRKQTEPTFDFCSPNEVDYVRLIDSKLKDMSDEEFETACSALQNNTIEPIIARIKELKQSIQNAIHKFNRDKNHIACLSEKIDSILMWSHYADYHKGFAIQYDFRNLVSQCVYCKDVKQCESIYSLDVYPVIYGNKRLDATEMVFEFLKHEAFNPQSQFITPDTMFYTKASLLKSSDWKYEKEWRLLYICSKPKAQNVIKFVPKAIYLGSRISDINEKIIMNLVRDKKIPVYKMILKNDNDKYKLNYICIKQSDKENAK